MEENENIMVCFYCGCTMDGLTESKIKIFGYPECCDKPMVEIEREKIYQSIEALEKIKDALEKETIKDFL